MNFEFATATRIVFGAGTADRLGEYVSGFGRRALLVTGNNPRRAEAILRQLSQSRVACVTFAVAGEPAVATVEQGVALARTERCEFVVALGGGSVIDAGKAMAAMLTNEGVLPDYLEIIGRGKSLTRPGAPFVAVPTTAGTGAEVTRNAVLASPENRVKVSLRSPFLLARLAVVDPDLTAGLPPALTASTGADALTQLIEPYVCRKTNPLTDGFCREGLLRVARSLRAAVQDGADKPAREDMAAASLLGGLSLANAGLGAVHGFAGPIGGSFPAPHGAVCGALLPYVMAANVRALRERAPGHPALVRYQHVASWLTGNARAPVDAGVDWVARLLADLPIPKLGAYGLGPEHLSALVAQAARASSMKANPIDLTPEELARTLRLAL